MQVYNLSALSYYRAHGLGHYMAHGLDPEKGPYKGPGAFLWFAMPLNEGFVMPLKGFWDVS